MYKLLAYLVVNVLGIVGTLIVVGNIPILVNNHIVNPLDLQKP